MVRFIILVVTDLKSLLIIPALSFRIVKVFENKDIIPLVLFVLIVPRLVILALFVAVIPNPPVPAPMFIVPSLIIEEPAPCILI